MVSTLVAAVDLTNAQVLGRVGPQRISIRSGRVQQIWGMEEPPPSGSAEADLTLDIKGDWISQGGVDVQINGALGLAFPDLGAGDLDKLQEVGDYLWEQGIDAYLPTLVTTSIQKFQRSLGGIQLAMSRTPRPKTAQILGAHLEGPFLNPTKRGAHPEEFLLPLTIENAQKVMGDWAAIVRVITLAPELDANLTVGGSVIPYLRGLGIIVSLGHSLATAQQATLAFEQGASLVTHAFNAMPGLHHREPGLLGVAVTRPGVYSGFIADGQHVDRVMLDWLLRAGNYEQRLFLVSDALSPLGLPDGRYPWDSREISVVQGTARLDDGTLSGTTLSLLVGAQNLVKWGLATPQQAIALAISAPRRALNLPESLEGTPEANLLQWRVTQSPDLDPDLTWQRLRLPVLTSGYGPDFPVDPELG
jgi:N-acetylglucosamine-6-phosphate deacetylase